MNKGPQLDTKTDVVPIINVSLVVVLTLMIISPFLDSSEHEVELPQARAHEAQDADKVEITYTVDGRIYLEEDELLLEEVRPVTAELFANAPTTIAVIKADKHVLYGHVEVLIGELEAAGAPEIALATKNEPVSAADAADEMTGAAAEESR